MTQKYIVLCGFRRVQAHKKLGLNTIQAKLYDSDEVLRVEINDLEIWGNIRTEIDKEELKRVSGLLVNEVERCLVKDEEKNTKINFRVTVGSSSITTTAKSITDLIEQASRALYAAKAAKKQS